MPTCPTSRTAPDDPSDSERIAMVTPRSQSIIGRAKELDDKTYDTKEHIAMVTPR